MGRIIMVVTVWLVMAAMMLVIALPVIAKNEGRGDQGPPFSSGMGKPGTSSEVIHDDGACVLHQGQTVKQTGGSCPVTT
jgi:hypothetical protein